MRTLKLQKMSASTNKVVTFFCDIYGTDADLFFILTNYLAAEKSKDRLT